MSYTPPEYLIWKLSQLAFNITWLKNHFREQSFSENVSKLLPRDFDTWNTRENFLSQNPRKASQERFLLVYLVFTCYWRQICSTQLSKPSPKLRSWAPLLVYDATVWLMAMVASLVVKENFYCNRHKLFSHFLCLRWSQASTLTAWLCQSSWLDTGEQSVNTPGYLAANSLGWQVVFRTSVLHQQLSSHLVTCCRLTNNLESCQNLPDLW